MPFQCVFSSFRPMKNWNSNGNRISLFNDFLGIVSCCRDSWALIPQKRLYFKRSKRNQNDNFLDFFRYIWKTPPHTRKMKENPSFVLQKKPVLKAVTLKQKEYHSETIKKENSFLSSSSIKLQIMWNRKEKSTNCYSNISLVIFKFMLQSCRKKSAFD